MSRPAVFSELSLTDARAAAQGKWLIIDFTAEWCGPCKHMDKTTWIDPAVVAWLKKRAVAVQIDVDHDPIASDFGVKAMPTVVAMKGTSEVDRIIGARSPAQLLEWLEGLEQGKTDLDRAREGVGDDLHRRKQLAQTLLMRGAIDEAMVELTWLWQNALRIDPSWVGVRHSYLVSDLQQAADRSQRARASLRALRDGAERGSRDWRSLNQALRDEAKTLAWFDETRAAGQKPPDVHDVRELLREHGRWKDLGELTAEPLKKLEQSFQLIEETLKGPLPEEQRAGIADYMRTSARSEAADLVRALKAAGRTDEAKAVADEARRRDASPEMRAALGE
jgi:thioredoxin-like negative regulator of GroEL